MVCYFQIVVQYIKVPFFFIRLKFPKFFNEFTLYIILLSIIILFPTGSRLLNAIGFVFSTYIIKSRSVII